MEYKDDKTGPPPDNPPPYSAEPTSQPHIGFTVPPPGPGQYPSPPQAPQGQPHVYVTAPPRAVITTVLVQQMGPVPASTVCKSCNLQVTTRVETKATMKTHLFALILCLIGCWPLACVPYCMDSCNNADHYCPNCGAYIGTYMN